MHIYCIDRNFHDVNLKHKRPHDLLTTEEHSHMQSYTDTHARKSARGSGENVLSIFRKAINSVILHYVMQKGIGLSLRLLQKFCGMSEKGETCHFQVVCLMNIPT